MTGAGGAKFGTLFWRTCVGIGTEGACVMGMGMGAGAGAAWTGAVRTGIGTAVVVGCGEKAVGCGENAWG